MEAEGKIIRLPYPLVGDAGTVWNACRDRLVEIGDENTDTAALERRAISLILRRVFDSEAA